MRLPDPLGVGETIFVSAGEGVKSAEEIVEWDESCVIESCVNGRDVSKNPNGERRRDQEIE